MPNRVAVVTGASRGIGKGIAIELCDAGFTVYITGRTVNEMAYLAGRGTAIPCDHRDDQQLYRAFDRIIEEQGHIDVLVNNAWGGYENMIEQGEYAGRVHSGSSRSGVGTRCSRPASEPLLWQLGWPRP